MNHFEDRVVFVTGGASGIGRGLAERMVRRGARVVLADADDAALHATAEALGVRGLTLDVRDASRVHEVIDEVQRTYGPIDVLINSAGIVRAGETHRLAYDDWKRVLDVNLYGVVNTIHAVYPAMVARRSGRIVNVASIAGLFPSAGQVSYVASKFAVVGLSHALRAEASAHGVSVQVACPGIIDTPMTRGFRVNSEKAARVEALIPRGMDVGACCDVVVRGMERNDATILVGGMAHALATLQRASPRLGSALNALSVRWLVR